MRDGSVDDSPPDPSAVTATIALPMPSTGLATSALRGCLQQLSTERDVDRRLVGRRVVDWMTFRVSGPEEHTSEAGDVWFSYTAVALTQVLGQASPASAGPGTADPGAAS